MGGLVGAAGLWWLFVKVSGVLVREGSFLCLGDLLMRRDLMFYV